MIKKMLRKFLRNESQDLMERVDYFMKHEAFSVINNIWCHKTKTRFDTLVHADFWASNILFQYDAENQPSNAVMVDFQHVGIGDPIRDIFSLIYSSTTSSFRFKHMEMLLRGYFSQFQKYFTGYCFMSRCNFDMFYENCLSYRKFGFVWGLYITSVVLYQDKRSRTGWVSTNQMRRNKCVRDVLTKRLEDIASDDGNVQSSYQEIRARLLDLIKEARTLNII